MAFMLVVNDDYSVCDCIRGYRAVYTRTACAHMSTALPTKNKVHDFLQKNVLKKFLLNRPLLYSKKKLQT